MNKSLASNSLLKIESIVLAQVGDFFPDIWKKVFNFFTSYHYRELIFALKTISLVISLILGVLIVFLLIKMNIKARVRGSISKVKKSISFNKSRITKKWAKIEKKLGSGVEANYKLAILEADKIFNETLKVIGYEAQIRLTNTEEIKKAGKIKNNIIEDSKFDITESDARTMVAVYKKGLEDLDVI